MKVYQIRKSYYDGHTDHGMYISPIFGNRKAAEDFLAALIDLPEDHDGKWTSDDDYSYPDNHPLILELDLLESADALVAEVPDARTFLNMVWS